MRRIVIGALSAVLLTVLGAGALPAGGIAGTSTPTCRGRPATIVGTPGRDVYFSDSIDNGDVVVLRGGNDEVQEGGHNVVVCGNRGRDFICLVGSVGGRETIFDGGPGKDAIGSLEPCDQGAPVNTPLTLFGGPGRDSIRGSVDNYPNAERKLRDSLKGGPGRDVMVAFRGQDTVGGGAGDDVIDGGLGKDLARGGAGDDVINGGGQDDRIYGNSGGDQLKGDRSDEPRGTDYANGGSQRDHCEAEHKVNCES
jgi:Ca2+-binding RTX toxin-like protein